VYNTEEERKDEILTVVIAGTAFMFSINNGLKFGNAKRFLYIKFILLVCILSERRANVITSLNYL